MLRYLIIAAFPVTNVPRSDANGGDFAIFVVVAALVWLMAYIVSEWWRVNK